MPAASAAPPPVDSLRVGAPHPRSLRCHLPKHNLLTEGGHGPPPSLARQQCRENRRRREVPPDFRDETAARPRPRRTELQRVLRRIHARIAVVATRGRFLPDSVQVFAKAPVPGDYLCYPVSQGSQGLTKQDQPRRPPCQGVDSLPRTSRVGAPKFGSHDPHHFPPDPAQDSIRARRHVVGGHSSGRLSRLFLRDFPVICPFHSPCCFPRLICCTVLLQG